jgi:predicted AAA+ superfamily ATPase
VVCVTFDTDDALVAALHDHNPWWDEGPAALAPGLPARRRSDYYHLARPDAGDSQFEDQPLLGLVGHHGVGKTTLLEQFVYDRLTDGAESERFCYVPFDADPLYQLRSDDQLVQALRYYERSVLGRVADPDPHFLLLDDVHRVEHPDKPGVEGWGTAVARALEARDDRHVVVTASAGVQVERELDRVDLPASARDVQPILHEKFRDYLFGLYPPLEGDDDRRVTPTPVRAGDGSLPAAIEDAAPARFAETLRGQHDRVADLARRIRSQVPHYLAMGGLLSYDADGAIEDARDLDVAAYGRLASDVRTAIYREIPGFESIRTIADLERLCTLAARNHGAPPVRYQRLVDLFDVDRRTLRNRYLSALADLYLLTPVTEYDNARPRSVRLYLRDTGVATALDDGDPHAALRDRDREAALAHLAAFDHTMRLAYGIEAVHGRDAPPTVQYWDGEAGTVDFVFEVDGTPVPVALAYRPPAEAARAALADFLATYDAPIGLLLAGDTVGETDGVGREGAVIKVPYWLYLMLC